MSCPTCGHRNTHYPSCSMQLDELDAFIARYKEALERIAAGDTDPTRIARATLDGVA